MKACIETNNVMVKERLIWVDWMKVIGMFLIVLGHTFPTGNQYIYSFSVPVFFLISGFLNSKKGDVKKIFVNLVIPMLIICTVNVLPMILLWMYNSEFSPDRVLRYFWNCIIGDQGEFKPDKGLGACWFIYSLAIMKVAHMYIKNKEILLMFTCAVAVILSQYHLRFCSSWINACVCYPFFYIGSTLKETNFSPNLTKKGTVFFLFSLFAIVSLTNYNGAPWCYRNEYGNDFILFILNGLAGSYALFYISRMLSAKFSPKMLFTFSNGTIVILGFHSFILSLAKFIIQRAGYSIDDLEKYIISLITFLCFYPYYIVCKKVYSYTAGK